MFIITVEYFTGLYKNGEKQYKLTTCETNNMNDHETVLDQIFGPDNYCILDVEEVVND